MKKYILLLPILLAVGLMTACTGGPSVCVIEGKTSFSEYKKAYLMDMKRNRLDSLAITDGNFQFQRTDSLNTPYMLIVRLVEEQPPHDWLEMPVVIEDGTVKLNIGEYVHTSGTMLNKGIQEFLNALQHCKNSLQSQDGIKAGEIESTFSAFYKQQILSNRNNVLGKYIFDEYGSNLTKGDRKEVKAQLGN